MGKPKFQDVEKLLTELIFPFYEIKRDMNVPIKGRPKENDAEHSWSLAMIACSLAERIDKSLDLGKIAQLAIVHDLVEVFAGDTSIWDKQLRSSKQKREEHALARIQKEFSAFPWIGEMCLEYETKSSPEAIFISAVDKYAATFTRYLDLLGGGTFYIKEVPITKKQFIRGIELTRQKAHAHQVVGEYYEEVLSALSSHSEWFVDAKNP